MRKLLTNRAQWIFLFVFLFLINPLSAQGVKLYATFYHDYFEGRTTSSGHVFKQEFFTAAHASIPLGTLVQVVNPQNGRWVIVIVNDRCPNPTIIDLSKAAAKQLDFMVEGKIPVEINYLTHNDYSLWEYQDSLFELDPNCSYEDWRDWLIIYSGMEDFSKKPNSKEIPKAAKKPKSKSRKK